MQVLWLIYIIVLFGHVFVIYVMKIYVSLSDYFKWNIFALYKVVHIIIIIIIIITSIGC